MAKSIGSLNSALAKTQRSLGDERAQAITSGRYSMSKKIVVYSQPG
jgi:hypothetical protein